MPIIPIQIIIRETRSGHQPGGFTNDLRSITIRVAKDAIKHVASAIKDQYLSLKDGRGKDVLDDGRYVVPG